MRVIHCADLHLDSKMTANLSKDQARERKGEILRTFGRMVEYAKSHAVTAIIIAGDMFDTRNVSVNVRSAVRDIIWRNSEIDFLYLKGNHDADSFLASLDEIPDNLCLFHEKWQSYAYGEVVITGVELDANNSGTVYNSLVLDADKFNIVTMHGQTAGYKSKDKTETISFDDLRNKNIDYLALGHVHKYHLDKLDARGVYCYSGCLEGRGFDECDEKGFVLLDIDTVSHTATTEFVPFASRTFYTVPVEVTGIHSTQDAAVCMEAAIAEGQYPSNSLVKFVLKGMVDVECELNTEFLEEQFLEYFYFAKVYDETKLWVNYEDYANDISLKGEFVRLVLASDMTEEEKSLVIRTGLQALQGEEITV